MPRCTNDQASFLIGCDVRCVCGAVNTASAQRSSCGTACASCVPSRLNWCGHAEGNLKIAPIFSTTCPCRLSVTKEQKSREAHSGTDSTDISAAAHCRKDQPKHSPHLRLVPLGMSMADLYLPVQQFSSGSRLGSTRKTSKKSRNGAFTGNCSKFSQQLKCPQNKGASIQV